MADGQVSSANVAASNSFLHGQKYSSRQVNIPLSPHAPAYTQPVP